jgi:hypothetical protein
MIFHIYLELYTTVWQGQTKFGTPPFVLLVCTFSFTVNESLRLPTKKNKSLRLITMFKIWNDTGTCTCIATECRYWMLTFHVWKWTYGSFHNPDVPFTSMEFLLILGLQCVLFGREFFSLYVLSIKCKTIHFYTSCRLMQLLSRTLSVHCLWLANRGKSERSFRAIVVGKFWWNWCLSGHIITY